MAITTRGRYGVRLLIDLAENAQENHISIATIAERQNISSRYLEQVSVILRRSGFIRSIKGAAGGFMLAKPASEIIIGDVLRALEGDILVADPPIQGEIETNYRRCIRKIVYKPLNEKIADIVDKTTLASMLGTVDCDDSYL